MNYPKEILDLISALQNLPTIGKKSAERLALYIYSTMDKQKAFELSEAIESVKEELDFCPHCGNVARKGEVCEICADSSRNHKIVMVVESTKDLFTIEKVGSFKGVYHVLGGAINLAFGVGVDDINIASLIKRVEEEGIEEVILATNATTEGETTARYIKILLEQADVLVTRIAHGIPFGADISYADELTLEKALEGRLKY